MPNISEYTDDRKLLRDYYGEAKARNPAYSHQLFSIKAGLKSKGFLYDALHGNRTISRSIIFSLSQAMRLNEYEMEYFVHPSASEINNCLSAMSTLLGYQLL